ncbi:MAG: tetratricopeptide repeat protein, partial [Spirochaetales bacterium]|nr:tetratricopeptide repeat protein [Spirochaetales bacterium]
MKKFSGFLIFIMILATFFSCASTEGNTGGGDTNMEVDTPPTAADTNGDAGADYLSLDQAIQQAADDISEKLSAGTRVSIVAFESESENLSDYIMDELSGALVDSSLEVADRRNLPYIFKELDFQMSGFVSDETALSVGKFLGAQLVITGQFVNAGGRYRCRVSSINAETAVHATSTRLDVRNDKQLKDMLASLKNNVLVSKAAGYGTAPPKTAGTFLDRGILFASRGEFEMAIEDFTEAIKLNPNLESAYILRGNALFASVSFVTDIG